MNSQSNSDEIRNTSQSHVSCNFFVSAFRFFERDVNGVREYFRRRFGYECAGYPSFDELERDDDLDIEVSCSGFTKEMEKDILQEYGMEEISEDDEESDADDAESNAGTVPNDEALLNEMREQVEAEVKFSEQRANERDQVKSISFNIQNYISSMAQHADDEIEVYEDALDDTQSDIPLKSVETKQSNDTDELNTTVDSLSSLHISKLSPDFDGNVSSNGDEDGDISSNGENVSSNGGDDGDILTDLDPTSRQYRLKMVEKMLEDARSHRSYSTSASTIAPSVISERIKRTLNVKEKREQRKKCVAKGEASAVTRIRSENRDTVKQYAGWDF